MSTSKEWPPSAGLTTIEVPRNDAVFTTLSSISINAPAAVVFDVLRNVAEYPKWNRFVPKVTIHSQPEGTAQDSQILNRDTSYTFHVVMDGAKPDKTNDTQLRVSDISTPEEPSDYVPADVLGSDGSFVPDLSTVYRIAWKSEGLYVKMGLRTERFHEVIILGDNECKVRNWENQGGFVARTVKWMFASTLNKKFQDWVEALKKFSEEKVTSQEYQYVTA